MKAFEAPLCGSTEFKEIEKRISKNEKVCITGCMDSGQVNVMSEITLGHKYGVIVTFSDQRAREIYDDYLLYDKDALYYPAKDFIFYDADVHGSLTFNERLDTIRKIIKNEHGVIITSVDSLMDKLVPLDKIKNNIIVLNSGDQIDLDDVKNKLSNMDYERVSQVDMPGQYAIRGEILDIYPLSEETPVRIDLWDDEIDSIRYFDAESQRSIEDTDKIIIYPAAEYILEKNEIAEGIEKIKKDLNTNEEKLRKQFSTEQAHRLKVTVNEFLERIGLGIGAASIDSYIDYFYDELSSLSDYLGGEDVVYVLDEPARIRERAEALENEFRESMVHRIEGGYMLPGQANVMTSWDEVLAGISNQKMVVLTKLIQKVKGINIDYRWDIGMKTIMSYNKSFELLIKDLKNYKKHGYRILLLTNSKTKGDRIAADISEYDIPAFFSDNLEREIKPGEIMVSYGNIHKGYELPDFKFVVITQSDIFGKENSRKRKSKKKYTGKRIADFSELHVGDYVVHENHGLGIYRGIEKIEVDKVVKDYIKIEYAGESNLYIPATGLDVIQKYSSSDAKAPKINKLGGQEWTQTKTRVKGAVKDIAKELIKIYSARQNQKGYSFSKDSVWQTEFEEQFPFEETNDQLSAIEDTKRDMESDKIMDRLICGDVGYGKTEIAIRAAFKAIQDGKQVAVLVPTTILAQQHYNTFNQRMKDYPVRIDLLSRFRTPKMVSDTKKGLKTGEVDIVVGTHKILSKDVVFKDLGLLIVDEAQRFGVTHKEKIKQLKNDVDVLTLSATPIPRTLHMSLAGIRDMSVLEEPPVERIPIQTYVMEYNDEMVREAILRELNRNGQVYYVYNRVNNISEIASHIQKLIPDANVTFAHGRMGERALEKIMYDFIEGEIDVLVSTTIIETGLDISNVNTIIIHDADNFGLSQLYQLRGRVGRSNRTSYAFLLYKRDKMLKEVAEKRLSAIKEFTELGSGFKISMRDLEIRGAGNVLGAEQHGHMALVGYDLYCKLLNEAVEAMKGEKVYDDFETKIDLNIDAFIPPDYIKSEMQKINVYKQIASIEDEQDYSDVLDELIDRFGEPKKNVINLLRVALLKSKAHKAWVTEIKGDGTTVKLFLYEKAEINPAGISDIVEKYNRRLKFDTSKNPCFVFNSQKKMVTMDEYMDVLNPLIDDLNSIKL